MGRGIAGAAIAFIVLAISCAIAGCQTAPGKGVSVEQRPAAAPKVRPARPDAPDKRLQPELPKDQPVEDLPTEPVAPALA